MRFCFGLPLIIQIGLTKSSHFFQSPAINTGNKRPLLALVQYTDTDRYGSGWLEYERHTNIIEVQWQPVFCLDRARKVVCRNAHANIDLQLGETDALA